MADERSIREIGAALERRGAESSALRMLQERIRALEVNATLGVLTPLEAGLMSTIELINRAHADPEVRGLRRSSTRGGDESRHPSPTAAEEARRTTTGGNGEVGVTLQQSALVAFNDLSSAAGKSRALSEGRCGGGAVRVLTEGIVNHLQVCPVIGRNSGPHDVVRDVLSHLVMQNGVTDEADGEKLLAVVDGGRISARVFLSPLQLPISGWMTALFVLACALRAPLHLPSSSSYRHAG